MIEVKDIHKSYGSGKNQHEVLKGINLAFRQNEFVAILGPSGSGKTTLLNVIGGLDHYDKGDLVINNISTKGYSDRDWDSYRNHSIGFIFQSYNLIQHQSILSNVEMALTISGISGQQRREMAKKALQEVGLGDHILKKPSQLSGGQMQRVAIARALVNNPSVVLADEPTGALDSKTSVQVMELLKKVAKDRLIIMVTHNPELAQQYATRIITLKDGEISGDSDPYLPEQTNAKVVKKNMGRASMSLFTALSLSFHNLWTKRSRTLLTAFAGSIGIIGIALIAALSSGVDDYIYRQEANMAYQYPLLVETLNMDVSSVLSDLSGQLVGQDSEHVEVIGFLERLFAVLDTNDLENLKSYLDEDAHDLSQYGTVEYVYNVKPQIYVSYDENVKRVCPDSTLDLLGIPISDLDTSFISSAITTNMFYCMPQEESLYLDRYDVKAGHWPQNEEECVLVLSPDGKISDYLLYIMGMRDPGQVDSYIQDFLSGKKVEPETAEGLRFDFEDFLGITFKVVNSSEYYTYDKEYGVWRNRSGESGFLRNLVSMGAPLRIVGVVQPKQEYGLGVLQTGIGYPFALVEKTMECAASSEIVQEQLKNPDVDIFSGTPFDESEANKELDPASLVNVDTDQLKSAILVDQEKLQTYFLNGANLDSIHISPPEMDLSGLQIQDQVISAVRAQLIADLPSLLSGIQFPPELFNELVQEILTDYMRFMQEQGYLDISTITELLSNYFRSDTFRTIVGDWAASLDTENQDEGYLQGKMDELAETLLYSLNAYLESHGTPQLPFLQNTFEEYLQTGRWKAFAQEKISDLLTENQIGEMLNGYIHDTIQPIIDSQISSAVEDMEGQMADAAESVAAQVRSSTALCIRNGIQNTISHGEECISLDMNRFMTAFSMKLDAEELSDVLLSMTNFSEKSLSGNLQKLGYVEFSHPKSILIYPKDFESKDAAIEVLNRYNHEMELLGQRSSTISYTDTLGNVMGTVSRIVTIISSTLIAAVAVSLVVSSIMIGVITYISVLERRKEIGILRAMGASKHNVAQIFNAETFITGFLSGSLGICLGYLLIIPLNSFLRNATQISDIRAFLPFKYALLLVLVSIILTTIGGIIPAHNASKNDPVESLRTE